MSTSKPAELPVPGPPSANSRCRPCQPTEAADRHRGRQCARIRRRYLV